MAELTTDLGSDPDYRGGTALVSRSSAGRSPLQVAHRIGLLLLHPLCLHTGRVDRVFDWLAAAGFRVFFAGTTRLTDETVRRVWRYQPHGHDPMRVRVFVRMLTWDDAVVIGVTSSPPARHSTASHLAGLKGPSDPRRLEPRHLRHHVGAANLLNNLVHTSDGPEAVIRETAILLGEGVAAEFWRAAVRRGDPAPGAAGWLAGPPRLFDDGRGVSPAHVLAGLRRKIADRPGQDGGTHDRRALAASVAEDADWLAGQDSLSPVDTLERYRQVAVPWVVGAASPPAGLPRDGAQFRLLALVESVLFGVPGAVADLDPEAICRENDARLDERERIALLSGYVSRRLGGEDTP